MHLNRRRFPSSFNTSTRVSREETVEETFRGGSFRGSPESYVLEFPSCPAAAGRISLTAMAPASFDLPALSVLSEKVTSRRKVGKERKREAEEKKRPCSGTVRNMRSTYKKREKKRTRERESDKGNREKRGRGFLRWAQGTSDSLPK